MTARRRRSAKRPAQGGLASIRVREDLYERLREHCNRTGTSMADLIDVLTTDLNDGN